MKYVIHILIGLPGSGKTFFAKNFLSKNSNTSIIDLDEYSNSLTNQAIRLSTKLKNIAYFNKGNKNEINVIFDGLILTNKDVDFLISNSKSYAKEIILHIWNEDRDTCLKNDCNRRILSSTNTIKTAKFEEFDISDISARNNFNKIKIENHIVQLKPDWILELEKKFLVVDDNLVSTSWCLGGTKENYDGHVESIEPDVQPDFVELDMLLEQIYPNITFLQYKKLFRELVKIEKEYESDYYGTRVYNAKYVCSLTDLILFIQSFN